MQEIVAAEALEIWVDNDGNLRLGGEPEDGEEEIVSNNEWIRSENNYFPAKDTKIVKTLPPGFYGIDVAQNKYFAYKQEINTDELYRLPDRNVNSVLSEINNFWTKAELFKEKKFVHKRGILFYGGPGCGKSSTINILSESVIKDGGVVFQIESAAELKYLIEFVHGYFRDIQPDTPIVVIIEDIDSLVQQNESLLLNFLSGENEVEHCVVIATTNRIDDLNDLLRRPSRFDRILELAPPSKESREFFLKQKDLDPLEIDKWVEASEGFSIAQLKELYIAVHMLDNDFQSIIDKLKEQEKSVKVSTFKPIKTSIGFGK